MSAFVQVPWLPTSDQFMQAIEAGSRVGQNREAEINRQNEELRRRVSFGGMPAGNPLQDAETAALTQRTADTEADRQAREQAFSANADLSRRGATPQEAYEQSGLGQFGIKPEDVLMRGRAPVTYKFGNNVVAVDPATGQTKTLFTAPDKPTAIPKYSGPVGLDILGHPTSTARLTLPEWARMGPGLPDKIRTNEPVASYIKWAMPTNGVTPFQPPAAAPSQSGEVTRLTPDGKKAIFDAATKQFLRYAE